VTCLRVFYITGQIQNATPTSAMKALKTSPFALEHAKVHALQAAVE
jgi:hypothetical protein